MLSDTKNFFKNLHFLSATASEGVWQLNICLHPSTTSWERVEKIIGDNVPPVQILWDVSPLSHMDRRPWRWLTDDVVAERSSWWRRCRSAERRQWNGRRLSFNDRQLIGLSVVPATSCQRRRHIRCSSHYLERSTVTQPRVSGRVHSHRQLRAKHKLCRIFIAANLAKLSQRLQLKQQRRGFENWGQEVAFFWQIRLRVLESSFLPVKASEWGIFSPEFCTFGRKSSDKKEIFRQAKIGGQLPPPRGFVMTPMHVRDKTWLHVK